MLLVKSLVESIPLLRDVMLLLLWMLAIFGIIGMQLFSGRWVVLLICPVPGIPLTPCPFPMSSCGC